MKNLIFTLIGLLLTTIGFTQTILLQEDFEGTTVSFTSTSATGLNNWASTTALASQSTKSYKAVTGVSDTIYLTSGTINCSTMSFVQLEFDHIAKLEFFDAGILYVSTNNGANWTKVTTGYLGGGQFSNIGNIFNATSYVDWLPANNSATPANSWWKHETFNLSTYVANAAQVKIRFALADGNATGAAGNYGWLLDNIKVTAAFSELIPPSIVLLSYPIDTAYTSGPFDVIAKITDGSGIDSAMVIYHTSTGLSDTLGMNLIATDTFKASIPFYGYGRSISYYVQAIDGSAAHNTDSVGPINFFCKYSPGGTFIVGTGTNINTTTSVPAVFGQYFTGDKEQFLILASELQAINAVGGAVSSIGFDVTSINSATSTGANHNNFTIKLKNTTASALTTTFESGLTQVYTVGSYQTVAGWNNFTFTTPFIWDGVSNLLIETCFDNYVSGGDYSLNAIINRTTTTFISATQYWSDGGGVCPTSTGTNYTIRPNMKLAMATPTSITNDIGVDQITNPTGGVVANQSFDVKVKIKNFGIDTIHSATINWKFDGVLQTPFSFTGQLYPDSLSSELIIGNKTVAGGAHSLLIWTDNPDGVADFNIINDSAAINFFACGALLNGGYTIGGTSPDYPTFSDAVLALNQCGISGPVIFNVAAGTYNEKIEIYPISGGSSTNTVTFKAANGDSTSVILKNDASGTVDNWVIKLNGVSNITFKNLTIEAADSNFCRAIVLGNLSHDINILNNVIKSTILQSTEDSKASLIFTLDSLGANVMIATNNMVNGSNAIEMFSNIARSGWQIKNNILTNHYGSGIQITNGNNTVIEGNKIQTTSGFDAYNGIALSNCTGTPTIFKNKILTTNTQIGYGIIVTNSTFITANPAMIYNNFIQLNANSSVNTLSGGIVILNTPNINILYNTSHITGNHVYSASLILYDQTATPNTENIVIKNNILTNAGSGYIYYTNDIDTANFINDYNNLFLWSGSKFGHLGTVDITSYSAWKTQTGDEANSQNIDPYYTNALDLHVNNNLLNGLATPLVGITDDIDGDLRNTTNPDFGADEFIPSPWDATTLEIISPISDCGLDSLETVSILVKNIGSATINGNFTGSYKLGTNAAVTENITATITAGDSLVFNFTTKADLDIFSLGKDSTFNLCTWVNLLNDPVKANDTVCGTVDSKYKPAPPTAVSPVSTNYATSKLITASSPDSIQWFASDTSSIALHSGSAFNTPILYDTTTFYAQAGGASGGIPISITTTMAAGNGQNGNMFDISAINTITIDSFLVSPQAIGSSICEVYYKTGTYLGSESNASAWTLLGSGTVVSLGSTAGNTASLHVGGLTIPAGQTYGIYVTSTTGTLNYTNGTTSNQTVTDNNMTITLGAGKSYPFGSTFTPRVFNGTIFYKLGAGGGSGSCSSLRTPVTVNVINFPQNDAGIIAVVNPAISVPSGVDQPITFRLKNYGVSTLTAVNINWKLNWQAQPSFAWTGSLPYKDSIDVIIDTLNFNGGIYYIEAYTTLPNNVADIYNSNDTSTMIFNACLSGSYTIGDTTGGANFDYPSFSAAKNALDVAGVCGHVIFNVDSGTYNEQVVFTNIPGSGPNATITFQSATGDSTSVVWKFQPTSTSDNYVVKLSGVKYLTLKGMTLKTTSSGASTYGNVVDLTGLASYNTITNCVIETPTTTSTYCNPIYLTGTNIHYNTFSNNHIVNGYYGILLYGVGSTSLSKGNRIINNLIEGFYNCGTYCYYHDSLSVEHNIITSNFAYGYGIYSAYCQNESRVVGNKVLIAPTSSLYGGIYIYYCTGTATKKGLIANNFISVTGTSTGTSYPLRSYYSNYQDIVFNSINLETASTTSNGINMYYGGNNNVINNNVRTNGSYAYYVPSSTSITTSDYNNFYSSGVNFVYWGGNQANLTALQAVSMKDIHSHSLNVPFISGTDLHILSTYLSSKGNSNPRVSDDIDGELRSLLPTIGADEVPLIPIDGGVSAILVPTATTNEFDTIHVKVIACNYGSDTLFSIPISYNVNGGNPTSMTFNVIMPPVTCDTFDLAYFISPAGNAIICAQTAITNDTNQFNDENCHNFIGIPQKDAYLVEILTLDEGCGLTTDSVKIKIRNLGGTTISGNLNASYQKIGASTVVNQAVTQSIPVNDSIIFTFNIPVDLSAGTTDTIHHVKAWISYLGDNVQYNDTAFTSTKSFHTPPAPTVTNITIPYGSPGTLTASSSTGDTLLWFDQQYGGNQLAQGTTYTTPIMYATDTFWVEARGGAPAALVTLGTGTIVNSNTGYPAPYGQFYNGARHQMLVKASELLALGATAGPISSLAFDVQTANGVALVGFEIKMGHTNLSALSTSNWSSNMTTVYSVGSYTDVTGWNTHNFSTPFIWNGTDNIIIETCFDNYPTGYTYNAQMVQSATSFVSSIWYNTDGGGACTNTAPSSSASQRPNMKFMLEPTGCSSPRTPLIATIGTQAAFDAGVYFISSPNSAVNLSIQETVKVRIKNYGTSSISNFPVSFKVNNLAPVTEIVTATLASQDTLEYTFSGKADLGLSGNTYQIKAYTNLTGDNTHLNDTTFKSVTNQLPNYCVCTATSSGYEKLTGISIGTWSFTNPPLESLYTDYTSVTPTAIVGPGLSYNISVSSNFPSGFNYQYSCWVNVFIDFNRDGDFDDLGEMAFSSATQSSATATGTLTVPFNAVSGITRMRVALRESGSQSNTGPCNTFSWGEVEDYNIMVMTPIPNDAGVEAFLSPSTIAATSTVPVNVRIRNYGTSNISAVNVAYKLNGGTPVLTSYNNTILPMDSVDISLGNVMLQPGANSICAYTILAGDSNLINDQLCKSVFREAVMNISYVDNFEGSDLWMPDTMMNQWQRGIPSKTNINTAHSPSKAWVVNLSGNYANNSNDKLYSPRILIPTIADSAFFKFWHFYDSQSGSDGGYIQFKINSGFWANLGYMGDPASTNWNTHNIGGTHMWSGNSNGWIQSKYTMNFIDPSNIFYGTQGDTIQFRFVFYSDASTNAYDGWAIDDFEITLPVIANDAGVVNIVNPGNSTQTGSVVAVTISIHNFGSQSQSSIPVAYKINSLNWVSETFTPAVPLMKDSTINYTFTNTFNSPGTSYQICAKTLLSGDIYTANDEICKSVGTTQASIDGAITNLTVTPVWPGVIMDTTKQSFSIFPIVEVSNAGLNPLSNITVEYAVNTSSWKTETIVGPIAPGASIVHQFSIPYSGPIGTYTINSRIVITGDANLINNEANKPLIGILDVGIDKINGGLVVKQNEPNPALETSSIEYFIPNSGLVKFELTNTLGQSILNTETEETAGKHIIKVDVTSLNNGVYYYTIEYNKNRKTMKMIVNK